MKRFIVYMGNYGSGKTELSLNTALEMAQHGKTTLVDMDIVNPYFRSAESHELLKQHGIRLIAPPFANTTVDVPALSAEVYSAFLDEHVVFDAGGDPVGATALGGFHEYFDEVEADLMVYYVVNARRPFQSDINDAVTMLQQIEASARLNINALINNTNTAKETTVDDLAYGAQLCDALSEKTGIPVAFTSGTAGVLQLYHNTGYSGKSKEIRIFTRPDWLDENE